jgi:surface-anchored protein
VSAVRASRLRRRSPLLVAAVAAALAASLPAATRAGPVVLQQGHVDVGTRIVGGVLRMQVGDGTAGPGAVVWREPADVVFHVRPAAATTVPASPSLAFLGSPGARVWLLPQVQRTDVLWPGWSTEELDPGTVSGAMRWTLQAVEGPGAFALFTTGTFGAVERRFDSGDGLPDTTAVALGTHAHGNWAFTAQGRYELTFAMRVTTASGEQLEDVETLVATVGDVDPQTGTPRPGGDRDGGRGGGGADGPEAGGGGSAPAPGEPGADRREPRTPGLRLGRVRLRDGALMVRVRLRAASRVRVVVRPRTGGRAVAASRPRSAGPGLRTLRVRLLRIPAPGRYRVAVRATAHGGRSQLRASTWRRLPSATTARGH